MSLLYIDGFEHRSTLGRYLIASSLGFNAATRFGVGWALKLTGGTLKLAFPASAQVFTGMAVQPGTANDSFFKAVGDSGATTHLTVRTNGVAGIEVRLGTELGTVIASSAANVLPPGVWSYLEVWATIADAGGRVIVRVNGVTVVDFTGDTKNGGTATTIDSVILGTTNTTASFDDWYICNSLGAAPYNTFLGDVTVHSLVPNGNGASSALVGSDGNSIDNYLLVDEQPIDPIDYNGSAVIGAKDTYALTDLPANVASVLAVQNSWYALKSDSGAGSARSVVRSGAVDYAGPTVALPTSVGFQQDLRTVDPATAAAWTVANVNALQAGMEVV